MSQAYVGRGVKHKVYKVPRKQIDNHNVRNVQNVRHCHEHKLASALANDQLVTHHRLLQAASRCSRRCRSSCRDSDVMFTLLVK